MKFFADLVNFNLYFHKSVSFFEYYKLNGTDFTELNYPVAIISNLI